MVSKNQLKLITSLQQKKFRKQHNLFIAEGYKVINELLQSSFVLHHLYETRPIFTQISPSKKTDISDADLKKISALTTPADCLAVFEIPQQRDMILSGLIIVLDDIRDPGNLGTIIRLCDWFGVQQIVCSKETADLYNPKVIQATMGSISRVQIMYTDLVGFLAESSFPIYGTFMDGNSVYETELAQNALLIMGNEANGISAEIEGLVTNRIKIPRFSKGQPTESLNVATATAIFLSEFRRSSGK